MIEPSLCQAYAILLEAMPFFDQSTADVNDIENEAKHADAELSRDLQLFGEWLDKSRKAVAERDVDNIGTALVHLRVHAMNIESIFRNLADSIMEIAFTEGEAG